LYEKPANGATDEQLLLKSREDVDPSSWSADGRFLLYTAVDPKTKGDLWVLPLEGEKKPFPFLRSEFNEGDGRFSPDGRWVAYMSDESGRYEIYVRPFDPDSPNGTPPGGGKWLISNNGGGHPRWRGDGRELYYMTLDGQLMAVEISTSPVFQAGAPKLLFRTAVGATATLTSFAWDLTADGKRFVFPSPSASAQGPFTAVLNWQAGLKK
jgi:Tol biopolymer transport system component